MEKVKEMKCYKRLIYKQVFQVSGLRGPQFPSHLPKRFTHLCRALYGDAVRPPEINKNIWSSGTNSTCPFYRGVRLIEVSVKRESTVLEMVILLKIKRRDFFNETAFLFWCHAL